MYCFGKLRREVSNTDKQQVVSKIMELISALEEIKSREGKRTGDVSGIQETIADLRRVLETLRGPGQAISPSQVLLVIYKTAERLYSWIKE